MSVHYNKQSLLEKHKKQAEQELAKRVVEGEITRSSTGRSPGRYCDYYLKRTKGVISWVK
jgi:hypothetical protein